MKDDMLYLLVVGSRSFSDYSLMCAKLNALTTNYTNITIVSGGASGADSLAERYANDNNLQFIKFPALWNTLGKSAGYVRNEVMHQFISQFEHRGVVAFWDGESKGTAHNFKLAKAYNNPIRVVRF